MSNNFETILDEVTTPIHKQIKKMNKADTIPGAAKAIEKIKSMVSDSGEMEKIRKKLIKKMNKADNIPKVQKIIALIQDLDRLTKEFN